jgi:hypothetical protein
VLADIEGQAVDEPGGGYTVYRSVKIHFDDETVKLPDDRILPLDTKEERKEVGTFLDALLAAIDINEPLDTGEPQ